MADSALVAAIMAALHAKWGAIPSTDVNGGMSCIADLIATGLFKNVKTASGAGYTVLDDDKFIAIAIATGASNRVVYLPSLANNQGRPLLVVKTDAAAGAISVQRAGADTIDGVTAIPLYSQYDGAILVGMPGCWHVAELKCHRNPATGSFSLYADGTALARSTATLYGHLATDTSKVLTVGLPLTFSDAGYTLAVAFQDNGGGAMPYQIWHSERTLTTTTFDIWYGTFGGGAFGYTAAAGYVRWIATGRWRA